MNAVIPRNRTFLENLFRRGPFERHGFVASPPQLPIWHLNGGDFTLSDRPVTDWVPMIVENYRRRLEMLEAVGHANLGRFFARCDALVTPVSN